MTPLLFLQMFAAGLAGGLLVTFIDNRLGKPIDPEREERAREWEKIASDLMADSFNELNSGSLIRADNKREASRAARNYAKAIRRGKA